MRDRMSDVGRADVGDACLHAWEFQRFELVGGEVTAYWFCAIPGCMETASRVHTFAEALEPPEPENPREHRHRYELVSVTAAATGSVVAGNYVCGKQRCDDALAFHAAVPPTRPRAGRH